MEMTFLAGDLKQDVRELSQVCSQNRTMESWRFIYIDPKTKRATANNEKVTLMAALKIETDMNEPFLIQGDRFNAILGALGDDAKVKLKPLENNMVELRSGRSRYKINTGQPEDFPLLKKMDSYTAVAIDNLDLALALSKVNSFVGKGDSRTWANGVQFKLSGQELSLGASNDHMASKAVMSFGEVKAVNKDEVDFDVIMHPEFNSFVSRSIGNSGGSSVLYVSEKAVALASPTGMIWGRLIDARYPDLEKIVKAPQESLVTVRTPLALVKDVFKRVKPLLTGKVANDSFTLTIDNGALKLKVSSDYGDSEDELGGLEVGKGSQFMLNSSYFESILNSQIGDFDIQYPASGDGKAFYVTEKVGGVTSFQVVATVTR